MMHGQRFKSTKVSVAYRQRIKRLFRHNRFKIFQEAQLGDPSLDRDFPEDNNAHCDFVVDVPDYSLCSFSKFLPIPPTTIGRCCCREAASQRPFAQFGNFLVGEFEIRTDPNLALAPARHSRLAFV